MPCGFGQVLPLVGWLALGRISSAIVVSRSSAGPRFALLEPIDLVIDTVDHAGHRRLRVGQPLIVVERSNRLSEERQQQLGRNRADLALELVDEVALDLADDRGTLLLLELD